MSNVSKRGAKVLFVGDFGNVEVSDQTLKAYGLPSFPINRRSSKQRQDLARLERNVAAVQAHYFITGHDCRKV